MATYRAEIQQTANYRQELYEGLEDYLDRAENRSMLPEAFHHLLSGDSRSLNDAKEVLLEIVARECWDPDEEYCRRDRIAANTLGRVSLAYDWLYEALSEPEREQVKARIATEVCRLYEASTYGANNVAEKWNNWWLTDYTQNHFHSVLGGMMLGALAIKNDNPPTCSAGNENGQLSTVTNQQIIEFGLHQMERNYLIFNRISDGSYPEGDSYVTAYTEIYLPALWAVDRLLTPQMVRDEWIKNYPLFYLYNSLPDQVWNRLTNHGDYYTSSRENDWVVRDLQLSGTINRNPLANWLVRQFYKDRYGESIRLYSGNSLVAENLVLALIFSDPNLSPQSPSEANLDLSYHAQDWEGVFMRSNWQDNAVAAAIKVGPPGGHTAYNIARSNQKIGILVGNGQEPTEFDLTVDHMHADANGIYLYSNGAFLLPEMHGYLDKTPWGRYTSSHNTIMVSDSWGRMRGQIQGDDIGGARFDYKWAPGSEHFWDIETPDSKVGILEHASTQSYDYSLGQATSAYWPELGLKRFHRHVLFMRDPGYMLVVDDLDAVSDKTYDWMGHSTGNVTQQGQWLKVEADNDQRLGIAMLSPDSEFIEASNEWEEFSLEDQYAFRYISEQRTMHEWRIRQNCQRCRFVNVLFPTDEANWTEKPEVTALADTDQLAAVQIDFDNGRTDTLAISLDPGQSLTAGSLTFDGRVASVQKKDSTWQRTFLAYGSQLQDGDTVLIENLSTSAYIEVQYQGAQVIIRSPNPFGTTLFAPSVTTVRWERVDKDSNEVITSSASFIKQDDYITLTAPE
ncbi:MAG: heparinase II/III family protein [Anaerolineae bacterium]|nr:heparinase II/III family protein [Anaerolineae bacterium]